MTDKEKLEKIKELADAMYYAAQHLTTDASGLHEAMDEYHKFIINEYHKEEVSDDLIEELKKIVNIRECVSQGVPVIKTARHFANLQKEQMMKDAVEARFTLLDGFCIDRELYKNYKVGGKYKLIVIKED